MASSDPPKRPRPGPWPPAPDPTAMPPSSWAKRTGFRPTISGDTNATDSGPIASRPKPRDPESQLDLESGRAPPVAASANGGADKEKVPPPPHSAAVEKDQAVKRRRESDSGGIGRKSSDALTANGQVTGAETLAPVRRPVRNDADGLPQVVDDDDGFGSRHSHMKYELRDKPGLGETYIVNHIV